MMTSDWLVDVFDDRYTTNYHQYQQQTNNLLSPQIIEHKKDHNKWNIIDWKWC